MRRRGWFHLGGFGLLVLCLPLLALAAEPQAPKGPDRPAASGEGYVVKKGDTLWGISKDLYDDPFLWPRLWDRNPFIKNPNRIYPGDTLALPGKELAPVPEPPKAAAPPPPPPPVATAPEPAAPPPPPPPQPVAVPEPPQPPLSEYALACMPVVLDEPTLGAIRTGKIIRSDKDQLLISQLDYVFVGVAGGQVYAPGDRLTVVRPAQRVVHPLSKKPLGRAVLTLGILEVAEVAGPTVKARVSYSCGAMAVGDWVQNYQLPPYPIGKDTEPATRQVQGVIVESLRGEMHLGAYNLVFVDVGAAQGAMPGDVFSVIRPSPPVIEGGSAKTGQLFPISPEQLGEGVIVRVGQEAATVVLTRTAKEALAGDAIFLSRQPKP